MTEHEISSENNGLLHALVQMMRAMSDSSALDRKTAAEDRRAMLDAVAAERRERTESIGRVHQRVDDLADGVRRIETGVSTLSEQLRQADTAQRAEIAVERARPRLALIDRAGAGLIVAAAAAFLGGMVVKLGWLPAWVMP